MKITIGFCCMMSFIRTNFDGMNLFVFAFDERQIIINIEGK